MLKRVAEAEGRTGVPGDPTSGRTFQLQTHLKLLANKKGTG